MTRPDLQLLPPSLIRPTEEILAERVDEVVAMVLERRAWTQPICVERATYALLDGHHRLAAARRLDLARVPVHLFDYADVELASWRPDHAPTRAEVLARARSGDLFPHKTTRHTFPDHPIRPVPLVDLIDGPSHGARTTRLATRIGRMEARAGGAVPMHSNAKRA